MRKKGIVIAGFAGTGKTYLAKKYKNVIDLESSGYKYDYSMISKVDYEKLKGDQHRIPNKDWPQNYIKALQDAKDKYDVVLIYICEEALEIYEKYNISFTVCYPSKNAFEKYYKKRYENRGNSKFWIDRAIAYYDHFVTNNLSKSTFEKIILEDNQTLEDALTGLGYNLEPNLI